MKHILHFLLLTMIICCWSCSGGGDEDIPTPAPKPETNKIEITSQNHFYQIQLENGMSESQAILYNFIE